MSAKSRCGLHRPRGRENLHPEAVTVQPGGGVWRMCVQDWRSEVIKLSGLPATIERNKIGHAPGKIILDLTR